MTDGPSVLAKALAAYSDAIVWDFESPDMVLSTTGESASQLERFQCVLNTVPVDSVEVRFDGRRSTSTDTAGNYLDLIGGASVSYLIGL